MNDGVKILLERMKTHPEEFVIEEGCVAKWDSLIRVYENVLPKEDVEEFKKARNVLLQQQFTEKVMEELIDPKSDSLEDVINQYRVKGMPSVGQTLGQSWVNTQLQQAQAVQNIQLHELLHHEALQKLTTTPAKKEHKTLFGRLFNYQ